MKEEKENNVFYYSDELNDDFASSDITPDKIDENYKYIHKNIFWNFFQLFYIGFFQPSFIFMLKLNIGLRQKTKKLLKIITKN